MRGGGGDHPDTEPRCEGGQRGVALVVEGMTVMSQLDADPVGAEPVHQIGQRSAGRLWAAGVQSLAHIRSEEHTSELQSHVNLVCRLLLEKKKNYITYR